MESVEPELAGACTSEDIDSADGIVIAIEADRSVNFAMQQNDIPIVRRVRIENRRTASLSNVRILFTSEPPFCRNHEVRIERINAESSHELYAVDLQLAPDYLNSVSERTKGVLIARLLEGDQEIAVQSHSIDVLARNEWGGLRSLPEILGAFVQPNATAVQHVLRDAAVALRAAGRDPSLSGYQSKSPKRVLEMSNAIYSVASTRNITYVNPPASFESEGQKIRTPDQILDHKLATCLDAAILVAGCLEQAGLHPLLILTQGHAFVGVWLIEHSFSESVVDDVIRLRTAVELDEIEVFDPTCFTQSPPAGFDRARKEARRRIQDSDQFVALIDVKRARMGKIRPIPEFSDAAILGPEGSQDFGESVAKIDFEIGSHLPETIQVVEPDQGQESPQTRIDRWRTKLLDLSMNNRLLSFRFSRKAVPLLCADVAELEDRLADGRRFTIHPRPKDMSAGDPRDPETYRRRTGEDAIESLLHDELQLDRLIADLAESDLEKNLLTLFREHRTQQEEGGASALFLAIGFLSWYETAESETQRLAPLILLPVELERKSVQQSFSLRVSTDEPRINVTLLELLNRDFGLSISGLDPLPQDESGLDVARILRTFREATRDIKRWEVVEFAHLGIFSFAKFLLWRDLTERASALMENPLVRHLVDRDGTEYGNGEPFPREEKLDTDYPPEDVFCPLPGDSSQLSAVVAAAEGRTFVLEGPPGTGKSQTITNLIAHCVAMGKTVLFVSEKMAALEVVHDRLRSVGLGNYVLELHSNKASKPEVYRQLRSAKRRPSAALEEDWSRVTQRLSGLRGDLNEYARALHQIRPNGYSVFQATSNLIGLKDAPVVALQWQHPEELDPIKLERTREVVDQIRTVSQVIGVPAQHPWKAVERPTYSPGWESEVRDSISQLRERIEEVRAASSGMSEFLGLAERGLSRQSLSLAFDLAGHLLNVPRVASRAIHESDWAESRALIADCSALGRARDQAREALLSDWSSDLVMSDLDALSVDWANAEQSIWPASFFRKRRVRKQLAAYAVSGEAPDSDQVAEVLSSAIALRELEAKVESHAADAAAVLGRSLWKDGNPDWDAVDGASDWVDTLRGFALKLAEGDLDRAGELRQRWARLIAESGEEIRVHGRYGSRLALYREKWRELTTAQTRVGELIENTEGNIWGPVEEIDALLRWLAMVDQWLQALPRLADWCAWLRVRNEARALGLTPLLEEFISGSIAPEDLRDAFDRGYFQWWRNSILDREPVLAQFLSAEHNRKIDQFQETDDDYTDLTKRVLAARMSGRLPDARKKDVPEEEIGLLAKEGKKKRRQLALRRLFERIPNLLPRLKPCLLMSPISVAQYLSPEQSSFDLVVFDEASQIPSWDAIGVLARGKQAVIVGDPKQLPPTNFFQRGDAELSDDDDLEDLESILDDCIASRVPTLGLNWHYRSRHESLITFSNYHYYDNRLLTFPSPDTKGMGVSWRFVADGIYDRGKSRTNRREAEEIVAEIKARVRNPDTRDQSIGVVTFNQSQRDLIEDLVDKERRDDHELDQQLSAADGNRLFIKNLENVQGDERDVILFSITYGKDHAGRPSMNFGPMNKEGGHRRLNVAVTRAKREVLVFSSLRADEIDLSRTRSRGVRDLKNFLEYAERGFRALAESATYDSDADFDSPFEEEVFYSLIERGYSVHKQVGCSGYRIDLAVVHPEYSGRYLLGIECDGANYHRAKTARDRDKLRESVLRGLGWEIHRIWSTDWWRNRDAELEKTVRVIEEALIRSRLENGEESNGAESQVETAARNGEVDEESLGDSDPNPDHQRDSVSDVDSSDVAVFPPVESFPLSHDESEQTREVGSEPRFGARSTPREISRREYAEFGGVAGPDPRVSTAAEVADGLVQIVEVEGPVIAKRAFDVYLRGCGVQRMGKEIKRLMNRALNRAIQDGRIESVDEDNRGGLIYRTLRISGAPHVLVRLRGPRSFFEIPTSEVRALIASLKADGKLGGDLESQIRAVATEIGIGRVTAKTRERLREIIEAGVPTDQR